jgi:hypothetical protein
VSTSQTWNARIEAGGTVRADMSSGLAADRGSALETSWTSAKARVRNHVFRLWTAGTILAAYIYGWLYAPEVLTWWKRTTTTAIEAGCDLLPYPWGDRIEATLGNFGLWVQITLAIIAFRMFIWVVMSVGRGVGGARHRARDRSLPLSMEAKATEAKGVQAREAQAREAQAREAIEASARVEPKCPGGR